MGKRIISRARGKGGPPYKSPGHRFKGKIRYPFEKGEVIDIVHDAARDAPVAVLKLESGNEILIVASEGMAVGHKIDPASAATMGNIVTISKVDKGAFVFGLENRPGAGPQLCLSPGTKAIVVGQEAKKTIVQMPSKRFKNFNPNCLVTVGIPAGGGRRDKRMLKAGQAYHAKRARNKLYPRTSGTAMNAVDHPFGGQTKPGMPKSVARSAPPGRKVGSIAPKRMGRRKR